MAFSLVAVRFVGSRGAGFEDRRGLTLDRLRRVPVGHFNSLRLDQKRDLLGVVSEQLPGIALVVDAVDALHFRGAGVEPDAANRLVAGRWEEKPVVLGREVFTGHGFSVRAPAIGAECHQGFDGAVHLTLGQFIEKAIAMLNRDNIPPLICNGSLGRELPLCLTCNGFPLQHCRWSFATFEIIPALYLE